MQENYKGTYGHTYTAQMDVILYAMKQNYHAYKQQKVYLMFSFERYEMFAIILRENVTSFPIIPHL